jgi:hypothetical protein
MKRVRDARLHTLGNAPNPMTGKWMLFVDDPDQTFQKLQTFVTAHDVFASRPVEQSSRSTGQAAVFVHPKTEDKEHVLALGNLLVSEMQYTSSNGYMCFKSVTHKTCAAVANSAAVQNYTYRIPVPLTILKNIPEFDDASMRMTTGDYGFEINFSTSHIAKSLGAIYDRESKKWCAETEEVWHKLAQYWRPLYNFDMGIFSMNIWKSLQNCEARMQFIVQEIKRRKPTLVLLQEVTRLALSILHPRMSELGYLGKYVASSDFFLVSYSLAPIAAFSMRGSIGRGFHVLQVVINKTPIAIANIHLAASEANSDFRIQQLSDVFHDLETCKKWLVAGDTNLGFRDELELPDQVIDAWTQTGSSIASLGTWNPRENTNLKHISEHVGMCRFDRMFSRGLIPVGFELVCRDTIPDINLHASDHFGIFAGFRFD